MLLLGDGGLPHVSTGRAAECQIDTSAGPAALRRWCCGNQNMVPIALAICAPSEGGLTPIPVNWMPVSTRLLTVVVEKVAPITGRHPAGPIQTPYQKFWRASA